MSQKTMEDRVIQPRASKSDVATVQSNLDNAVTAAANALTASQTAQDATIAGKQDKAPNDGNFYVQKNGAWIKLSAAVIAALPPT